MAEDLPKEVKSYVRRKQLEMRRAGTHSQPAGHPTVTKKVEEKRRGMTREDPIVVDTPGGRQEPNMPGAFDIDLTNEGSVSSYAQIPTPVAALSPITPRDPESIRDIKVEINVGYISNEVPMDPEFSPEPPETLGITRRGGVQGERGGRQMWSQGEGQRRQRREGSLRKGRRR